MAQTRFSFPTGAGGDAATGANTGSSFVVVTGGTLAISTAQAVIGTRSLLMTATSTSGACYITKQGLASTAMATDYYLYLTAAPSAAQQIIFYGAGSSQRVSLELNADRTVTIRDDAYAAAWTSTYVIPLNTWVRVALYAVASSTVGQVRAAVFLGNSTTPTSGGDSGLLTNKNTGADAWTDLRLGMKCATGTATGTGYMGSWAYDDAATGLTAPYSTAPTANAGADITVDAGEAYTLTGVGSDVEGAVTVAWKLSGAVVGTSSTLNRTGAITLAGSTETYTFEVTDGDSNITSDTVVVTARPATTRLRVGTATLPAITRLTE